MLRVETQFQDTPDGEFYFVLFYGGRPLAEQLDELGLKDGDTVTLWEEECGDYTLEAKLRVDYHHPRGFGRRLWAQAIAVPDGGMTSA